MCPQSCPINIITDSIVAINQLERSIYRADGNVSDVNPKYQTTVKRIIHELACERVRLYHIKGHTDKQRKYSQVQAICDRLAKKAR